MATNFVQNKNSTNQVDVSSTAVTFDSTTVTGNLIAVIITGKIVSGGTVSSVTDNIGGNTYSLAVSQLGTSFPDWCSKIYYCLNANGGVSHQVTVNFSGAFFNGYVSIVEISGPTALDQTPAGVVATASPTTVTTGTLATASGVAFATCSAFFSDGGFATPSGFTTLLDVDTWGTNQTDVALGYQLVSSTAAVSATWTDSTSGFERVAVLCTFSAPTKSLLFDPCPRQYMLVR